MPEPFIKQENSRCLENVIISAFDDVIVNAHYRSLQ